MDEKLIEGTVIYVSFRPPQGGTSIVTIYLAGDSESSHGYPVTWLDNKLTFDGVVVTFPDLMSKIAEARNPVHVKLHWRDSAYVHCTHAEFSSVNDV